MNMRHFFRFSYLFLVSALVLVACSKDDDSPIVDDDHGGSGEPYQYGYFVLNEGTFGNADASVTFIGDNGIVHPEIFQTVNGNPLGDIAQSISFEGDNAYIVVNGSNKIEVVDRFTFEHQATLSTSLVNPRYIEFVGGKGYVSNWGDPSSGADDFIAVINLDTFEVEQTIPVAEGPEKMVFSNGKLFVAHKGGWSFGNTVSVINPNNQSLETTIEVLDTPDSLLAIGDQLYVLCSGVPSWMGDQATAGALLVIDITNYTVVDSYPFAASVDPMNLSHSGETLYFNTGNQIYRLSPSNPSGPSPIFTVSDHGATGIYGLSVRGSQIYITDPKDYNSQGEIYIFTPTGELLHKHAVGIVPNGVYFH